MSIVVFYLRRKNSAGGVPMVTPHCEAFGNESGSLGLALKACENLRKQSDVCHVTMSSELNDMVGKAGVDSVIDGKTPDGHAYDWSKSGRAGKMRRSERLQTSKS
jgi:hypothetical protein